MTRTCWVKRSGPPADNQLSLQKEETLNGFPILLIVQLQIHCGVHRCPVRSVPPGGAEDQAHAAQLPWHPHPRLLVLYRSDGTLAEIPGPGDDEETRQQGELWQQHINHFSIEHVWYLCDPEQRFLFLLLWDIHPGGVAWWNNLFLFPWPRALIVLSYKRLTSRSKGRKMLRGRKILVLQQKTDPAWSSPAVLQDLFGQLAKIKD